MNSVWEVLKSKLRLMLYTFALSMKNSRLLCLCEESLLWTILDTITTGFRSNISLSSCYKLISTFEVHSKIESLWIPRPWGCDNKGRILTWLNPQAFKGIITEDSGLIVISWHYKNLDSGASSILKPLLNSSSILLLIKKELLWLFLEVWISWTSIGICKLFVIYIGDLTIRCFIPFLV